MTTAEFDALRGQRREMARQLRDQGLPLREIGARLGVSHFTVIEDLKGPAMTATAVARPKYSEQNVKLNMLLSALERLGQPGQLADLAPARLLLARAAEVENDAREAVARARNSHDALVGALADGKLSVAEAALKAGELSPWLRPVSDAESARGLTERLAAELRSRAFASAREDGMAAHGKLSKLAEAAVARGARAGEQLFDVHKFISALRAGIAAAAPPPDRVNTGPSGGGFSRSPVPKLPSPTVAEIEGDAVKMGLWAQASAAVDEMNLLFETAGLLHAVMGGSSALYAGTVDSDFRHLIGRDLAAPLQFAVTSALGWRPGLWLDSRPRAPRPFDMVTDNPPVTPVYPRLETR